MINKKCDIFPICLSLCRLNSIFYLFFFLNLNKSHTKKKHKKMIIIKLLNTEKKIFKLELSLNKNLNKQNIKTYNKKKITKEVVPLFISTINTRK